MAIIKDPIGFLGNLVSAVGAGLKQFMANIGEHLKKGLVGWLLGRWPRRGSSCRRSSTCAASSLMIALPARADLGVHPRPDHQRGVPEQAMGAVEKAVPLVQKSAGPGASAGCGRRSRTRSATSRRTCSRKISEYLIPTVIMAGHHLDHLAAQPRVGVRPRGAR